MHDMPHFTERWRAGSVLAASTSDNGRRKSFDPVRALRTRDGQTLSMLSLGFEMTTFDDLTRHRGIPADRPSRGPARAAQASRSSMSSRTSCAQRQATAIFAAQRSGAS